MSAATTAPSASSGSATKTARHWETTLFSRGPVTAASRRGRGRDAPVYDGIDDQLADARTRLERVSARAAFQEVLYGRAVLVDIRPAAQRAAEGDVAEHLRPVVVERNVLEWRFDPRHEARLPVAGFGARVIVLCQEGYTSSLAADALVRLGVARATDVVGGFAAWRAAGLPVARPHE